MSAPITPANEPITIFANCSDDEDDYNRLGFTFGPSSWSPQPAEVAELYESISKTPNKLLEFSWKFPGRRNPEEEGKLAAKKKESLSAPKASEPKGTDFDFEEESAPSLVRKKSVPLKRTTKKKAATSLTGILASMERHRIMDQQASESPETHPAAPGSSTNTPSTS